MICTDHFEENEASIHYIGAKRVYLYSAGKGSSAGAGLSKTERGNSAKTEGV